jgi:hypothetical protein
MVREIACTSINQMKYGVLGFLNTSPNVAMFCNFLVPIEWSCFLAAFPGRKNKEKGKRFVSGD